MKNFTVRILKFLARRAVRKKILYKYSVYIEQFMLEAQVEITKQKIAEEKLKPLREQVKRLCEFARGIGFAIKDMEPLSDEEKLKEKLRPTPEISEEWRPIKGFVDREFMVSNHGYVKINKLFLTSRHNLKMGSIKGYPVVYCRNGKRQKMFYIHKLVASTFLGDVSHGEIVHIDGNHANNNILNLKFIPKQQ